MLNPDVIKRLRDRIASDGHISSFDGYTLQSLPLAPGLLEGIEVVAVEPAWSGELPGPQNVFGTPVDPSCLTGIGKSIREVREKRLFKIPEATIVGNNAVISRKGGIFAPSPVATAADLRRLAEGNRHNHQGFAITGSEEKPVAYYAARAHPRRLDMDVLLLHNLEPSNYGSFLFRQLPQILFTSGLDIQVDAYIVPDRMPWLYEALRACGMADRPIFTIREISGDIFRHVFSCSDFDSEGVLSADTMAHLQDLCDRVAPSSVGPKRIFVSRTLTGISRPDYRPLLNEPEIEAFAETLGFKTIYPETLSFSNQIRIFRSAEEIAGPSGSGMLNAMFCLRNSKVLDMESFTFTVRQHSKIYSSANLRYAFLFGQLDASDSQPPLFSRWSVPLKLAREGFEWLIADAS